MAQLFKVSLGLTRKQPTEGAVYFKVDGGRFQAAKTIKLNVDTHYKLEVTFRPAQVLQSINVLGGNITAEETKRDHSCSVYDVIWQTTGVGVNKNGKRQEIPIILQIKDKGEMKVILQCKLYKEEDKQHAHWGDSFHCIEYECKIPDGSTYIDVLKETFR